MLTQNQLSKFTYRLEAFSTLKVFFNQVDYFFKKQEKTIEEYIGDLPEYLFLFLIEEGFLRKIEEINQHTASLPNFRKRFFHYFNAFKILKYLNFVHPAYFELKDVQEQYALIHQGSKFKIQKSKNNS
jgi:hypothetical protein